MVSAHAKVKRAGDSGGRVWRARKALPLLILFAAAGLLRTASAQDFGQNKVQYENFDFSVLHTPHFDIYFYPEEKEAARYASAMAERWYARHATVFADSLHGVQPLILYASFPQFEVTNVVQGIGVGTGGVTEPALRRIVLPFAGPLNETSHVIGHELVHAFQYDMTGRGRAGSRGAPGAERLPLWFIEGMAEYFSLGPVDPNTAMWMREATRKKLPKVSDLDNPKYFPYRYGQALLAYIGGRWGDDKVAELLRVAGESGNIDRAIDSVLTIKPDSLSKAWHAALHAQYDPLLRGTSQPQDYGRLLIHGKNGKGDLNVSPVLSPDGSQLVFFSTRDLFSIDLFLADAQTGKVKKTILKTALDPHLEGLEFISSAGSWDPAGQRFVFSAVRKGRPSLEILNVNRARIEKEVAFKDLGEILSPAWSPDGRTIAFSAIAGGLSDLFLYDLDQGTLRRLTHDPYADMQPVWSPDGSSLVFATDRFTTDLSELNFGHYHLARLNLESGTLTRLKDNDVADNINPQFSADGSAVFFISDRGGIPNVYRLDLAGNEVVQVTNLYGGVSGITSLSPAISVAAHTNRLVYSNFEDDKYSIWDIAPEKLSAGTPPVAYAVGADVLPPAHRETATLTKDLSDARFGLPSNPSAFAATPYHPSFKLVGAGQTELGVGMGPFGNYAGGGVTLFWTDMLGNRNLETALSVQTGNGVSEVSGLLGYANTGHRAYWGTAIDQVPYIYTGSSIDSEVVNGHPAYVARDYIFRQTDREITGSVSYPFSTVTRLDLAAGFRNTTFGEEADVRAISADSGQVLLDTHQNLPHPSALNLGMGSVALVYDNSVLGSTSPILGRRWRLAVMPTVGSLSWTDFLAEYRRYVMPVRPVTLAGRILHYGRYGRAAENSALSPLYLGYPSLLRGYSSGLLNGTSVPLVADASSIFSDPLYGSRILVANAEIRFPLFGILGLGQGYYGFFPVDLATFFDTGVAWWSDEKAWFQGGPRHLLSSTGEALRVNLFGYAVAELDYAKPLNGPDRSWKWELNLVEGF